MINGVIVPSITIFNNDYTLNKEANYFLFKHIEVNGGNCIFLFGSTGEGLFYHDRIDAKIELIELAYKTVKKNIPIICGAFGNSEGIVIKHIEELGKRFSKLAFVIAPPFERKLNSEELIGYLESILSSVSVSNKIIIYNNPRNFANNKLELKDLKRLLKFANIFGIKDTSEGFKDTQKFLEILSEDFCVFCGEELNYSKFFQTIPSNLVEYSGVVPSISNISNICYQMYRSLLDDKAENLPNLQEKLNEIDKKIYDHQLFKGNEQRGLKYALYLLYKERMSSTESNLMNFTPTLKEYLGQSKKREISEALGELIRSKYINIF